MRFDIAADKPKKNGHANIRLNSTDSINAFADHTAKIYKLNTAFGDKAFGVSYNDPDGKATLHLQIPDITIKAEGKKTGQGAVFFQKGDMMN